jgi:hypothetical protein
MGYMYLIMALVALGGGGYGVWTYNSAIKGKAEAEARVTDLTNAYSSLASSAKDLQDSLNASGELARARAARAAVAEKRAGLLEKELEDAKGKEPGVRAWANEPVPDSIRVLIGSVDPTTPGTVRDSNGKSSGDSPPKVQ